MTQEEFVSASFERRPSGIFLMGAPVMEFWERDMMRESVAQICVLVHPKIVLEIGYGFGYSEDAFDEYGLETHIVIEPHPEILPAARIWAASGPGRILIEDFAQNVKELPYDFDLIYDDSHDFTYQLAHFAQWFRFNFHHFAKMPQNEHDAEKLGNDFFFNLKGTRYSQPFYTNPRFMKR